MPKGRKRTGEEYEEEIRETAKRMRKHLESLRPAKDSKTWLDFLANFGVKPEILRSESGQNFWESVREKVFARQIKRQSIYQQAREAGIPVKTARRIRDWSRERAEREIERWKSR